MKRVTVDFNPDYKDEFLVGRAEYATGDPQVGEKVLAYEDEWTYATGTVEFVSDQGSIAVKIDWDTFGQPYDA